MGDDVPGVRVRWTLRQRALSFWFRWRQCRTVCPLCWSQANPENHSYGKDVCSTVWPAAWPEPGDDDDRWPTDDHEGDQS